MPRGAKKTANQHNSRHENGVVAPGKRITKQKSNGHLNGSPDARSQSDTPPPPSPSTPQLMTHLRDKSATGSSVSIRDVDHSEARPEELDTGLLEDFSEASESQMNGTTHTVEMLEHSHRKIDVNSAKNPAVHESSALHLALTILRSCPLGDTIAILIFLLSLPPTLLTVTNALFAVLTFMPPAVSFSSLPTTFNDVFQGSGGTPSFATICITDIIGLVLWLVIYTPVQVLALEMAQAVVATTLGGGNTSKSASSDSTLLCMFIVFVTHVVRHEWLPRSILGYDWASRLDSIYGFPKDPVIFSKDDKIIARSPIGWFRVLIALHILIQGLVHMARRWYTKREYSQAASFSKKSDPEAVAGSQVHSDGTSSVDPSFNVTVPSSEIIPKSAIPSLAELREKVTSGKKRRKQGNFVRSQQPLWAAFAATKVTVVREYEQSQSTSEAVGSDATDIKNLGSAAFVSEENRIWVTLVQPSSFYFDTSYFSPRGLADHGEDSDTTSATSIDRSKPFYVRINGANWTSTKIERTLKSDRNSAQTSIDKPPWTGQVFGLSPSCTYNCKFVRSEDDVVLHSASVSTPSSPTKETEFSTLVNPPHPSLRPSSPTTPSTTLKNSIAAIENSLNERYSYQKRNKKDCKATSTNAKKEIDILRSKISKIGGDDKSQHSRHLQWNQHFRQADDAIAFISSEIDSMGSIPENDIREWKEKRASWDEERRQQSSTREDLFRSKESSHRETSAVQAEATTTLQKRERLQARDGKLNDQHDRLQSATVQGVDEQGRRNAEQTAREIDRHHNDERSTEQMNQLTQSIHETRYHSQQSWQQAQILENAFHQQQLMGAASENDEPITPEGELPGTVPPNPSLSTFRFPAFGSPDATNHAHIQGLPIHYEGRPRSNTMLSGNSNYTDFSDMSDADPAPPMPSSRIMEAIRDRQQSRSTGSGSGSGSAGSQRDPMSPVGAAAQLSPRVSKSSPVWN